MLENDGEEDDDEDDDDNDEDDEDDEDDNDDDDDDDNDDDDDDDDDDDYDDSVSLVISVNLFGSHSFTRYFSLMVIKFYIKLVAVEVMVLLLW